MTAIGKRLKRTGGVHCEPEIVCGEHVLIRVVAKCGCFWPWDDGKDGQLARVVWWIGKTEGGSTVLAYGDIANWFEDSAPEYHEKLPHWYPTIVKGYVRLLKAMTGNAMCPEWEDFIKEVKPKSVDGLYRVCFDEAIGRKSVLLHGQKVLEMLLRVDGVEKSDDGESDVMYGSPAWVREVTPHGGGIAARIRAWHI